MAHFRKIRIFVDKTDASGILLTQHSSVSLSLSRLFLLRFIFLSHQSFIHESLFSLLSHTPSVKNSLPRRRSISLFFSRDREPSRVEPSRPAISLVTRSFLRARQVIFHHLHFFVHCAEIAGVLALPQLIFRPVEAWLSIERWRGRRPFPRRKRRAHPSSETESLLQRNTIPVR